MVLLVIDTQAALVNSRLYAYNKFVKNIEYLINKARQKHTEVIYVVHDDGPESDLTAGASGFDIFGKFTPKETEKIFVKKVNSAFKNTGLLEYLTLKGEKNIIMVGLQTDKCINATVISGFEYGFHIMIPALTNSTIDNDYMESQKSYLYYNEFLWPGRFAECISIEDTVKRMNT